MTASFLTCQMHLRQLIIGLNLIKPLVDELWGRAIKNGCHSLNCMRPHALETTSL
jgi:hypothetical protein